MRKTILQFYPASSLIGGAAKSNLQISEILLDKGFNVVSIIPFNPKSHDLIQELRSRNMKYLRLITPYSTVAMRHENIISAVREYIILILKLLWILPNELLLVFVSLYYGKNRVIFYHGGGNLIMGYLASRLVKAPLVVHIREFIEEDQGWMYWSPSIERKYFTSASIVICISKAIKQKFELLYPAARFTTIYNAISFSVHEISKEQEPVDKKLTRLVVVGVVAEHKGQLDAIKALSQLVGKKYPVHLDIVGSVPKASRDYYSILTSFIHAHRLEQFISFRGYADPVKYYNSSDIALICSKCEAFGRVTVEAAGYGCSIVGANTGATPELIEQIGGLEYKSGNPLDLADKIQQIIDSEQYFAQQAQQSASKVRDEFSIQHLSNSLSSVFSAL